MNACEPMQIAKLNLRSGRGRTLKTKTDMALRRLRRDRRGDCDVYSVEMIDETGDVVLYGNTDSLRQARFWQLRIMHGGGECGVFDLRTGIQIF